MICHRFRTIFVHIPKTGGQSVEQVFLDKMRLSWETRAPLLMRENIDPRLGPDRLDHLYASEYVRLGHVAPIDFDSYFKFAIVRNPWERLVSEYKFIARPEVAFSDFILKRFPAGGSSDRGRHVAPQWRFICDQSKAVIVDKVIRFENLKEELENTFRQIFGDATELPHINASKDKRDYRTFYSQPTLDFVANFYREDIELLGYKFD